MSNSKLLSYVFVIIGLFIIVLVTKWQVYNFQAVRAEKEALLKTEIEKKSELEQIQKLKKDLASDTSSEVYKYTSVLKEDELINFIYSEIDKSNKRSSSQIIINSLNISSAQLNQMQFLESNINLNLTVPNEIRLKSILDMLNKNEKYKFFITSLTYDTEKQDSDSENLGFQVTIPLKIFYK